jgi:hypothetical protein
MLAFLNGWEIALILSVVLIIFRSNFGGGSGGIGNHSPVVYPDILDCLVKAKEDLWQRFGLKG